MTQHGVVPTKEPGMAIESGVDGTEHREPRGPEIGCGLSQRGAA